MIVLLRAFCRKCAINWQFLVFSIFSFCVLLQVLLILEYRLKNPWKHFGEFNASVGEYPAEERNLTVKEIQETIEKINFEQKILNEQFFGPLTNDSVIIVVQVHRRVYHLKELIHSLSLANEISKVLLIFSHDFYDTEINEIVQRIGFCKVLQIYYPFSIQTHPDVFPGVDPKDLKCAAEEKENGTLCSNDRDTYGHFREGNITQIKHHWFWKANFVFNGVARNHTGPVIFLEEDHYVAEDFLHVLKVIQKDMPKRCPECNIISLGSYEKRNFINNANSVHVTLWQGNKHNMGMVLDRRMWQEISKCAETFCNYDDYNWDWSLQRVSLKCLKDPLKVAAVTAPRVFHVGVCGTHVHKNGCRMQEATEETRNLLQAANRVGKLFPRNLHWTTRFSSASLLNRWQTPNGGWGDRRDRQICLNFTRTRGNIDEPL